MSFHKEIARSATDLFSNHLIPQKLLGKRTAPVVELKNVLLAGAYLKNL